MTIQQNPSRDPGARRPDMGPDAISGTDLARLYKTAAQAHAALMSGEVARYFEMVAPADDMVLMTPVGGTTQRRASYSPEEVEEMRGFFRGGTGSAELLAAHGSGELAVLVMIERARARIAEFPEQDWALRVTLVFRRTAEGWRLLHRHADPLVARIGWDRSAELARG